MTKTRSTPARDSFPTKEEPRSDTATADEIADSREAPELAQSFTPSEARKIVELNLRPIDAHWFETTISGPDLITHNWSKKAINEMLRNQQISPAEKRLLKQQGRAPKNPTGDFEGARYRFDGKDWFPSVGVKNAMVSAGFACGIPRSIIKRCVFVTGAERRDFLEIRYRKLIMREDPVRVGPWNKREADLRYRPEYQDWSLDLRIRYRADVFTPTQVVTLLQNAGFSIGIGEWRPEKNGQHGTFEVAQAAEKKARVA